MRCEARVPRAPGDHDDRGNLAAHRCTKPARESILIGKELHGLCTIHYRQWRRQNGYIAIASTWTKQ